MLHMKYNSNIYYFQLPEKLKTHDYTIFFHINTLEKYFTKNPIFMHFAVHINMQVYILKL